MFFEKPGCIGNRQQKSVLRSQGHSFHVRNLLTTLWTKKTLRPFFNDAPVSEWFNLSAPQIKEGWIDIHDLDEDQALNLMLKEPLLIRRPLMQMGDLRQSGFVAGPVIAALGVDLDPDKDLQSCPMTEAAPVCGVSA